MLVKNNAGRAIYTDDPIRTCLDIAINWLYKYDKKGMPTPEEWSKNRGMPTIQTVEELFGSYDEMIGILEKKLARLKRSGDKLKKGEKYTDVGLARILYLVYQDKGGYFTGSEYREWRGKHGTKNFPSVTTVAKRLGGGKWSQEMFDYAGQLLGLNSRPSGLPSKSMRALEFEPVPVPLDLGDEIKFKSYRLISLLDYDCRFNFDGHYISAQKDSLSAVIKECKTIKSIAPGKSEKISQFKLILEQNGHEIEFPEPAPGVVYLIDSSLYESIPTSQRRSDLLPVYQSQYFESDPLGLHVLAL